jgi:hypothetical protein
MVATESLLVFDVSPVRVFDPTGPVVDVGPVRQGRDGAAEAGVERSVSGDGSPAWGARR